LLKRSEGTVLSFDEDEAGISTLRAPASRETCKSSDKLSIFNIEPPMVIVPRIRYFSQNKMNKLPSYIDLFQVLYLL